MMVVVRAKEVTRNLPPIVRAELRKLDENFTVSNMKTMEEVVGESLGQRRFTMFLLSAFALIGLAGVLATTRFLESLVFGISTIDAATFGSVVVLLATVALLACYLPAWRATKVDPIVTLRYE